jgi:single-strand DNA-binding protein
MSTRSLNKVTLIGNVTRDPNLRYTPNGASVCSFGVATNRSWTPADGGEKVEKAEFHNIVAWGKLADICGQLLGKGDKVYVDGRIQTRDWKTDEGQERRITEIVIDNMMLLNSRSGKSFSNDDSDDTSYPSSAKSFKPSKKDDQSDDDQETSGVEDIADDIPF